jgi:hypothetical protein
MESVTAVGLDPVPRFLGNQGRGENEARDLRGPVLENVSYADGIFVNIETDEKRGRVIHG